MNLTLLTLFVVAGVAVLLDLRQHMSDSSESTDPGSPPVDTPVDTPVDPAVPRPSAPEVDDEDDFNPFDDLYEYDSPDDDLGSNVIRGPWGPLSPHYEPAFSDPPLDLLEPFGCDDSSGFDDFVLDDLGLGDPFDSYEWSGFDPD